MTREEQRTELLVYRIKDNCYEVSKKLLEEHDKQIRAEERKKVLNAVYDCGWHCEVHTREALDEMVTEQLKEQNK